MPTEGRRLSTLLAVAISSLYKGVAQVSFVQDVKFKLENSMPTFPRSNCCLLCSFLFVLSATLLGQSPQWEQFPPTPDLPKPSRSGLAAVNGVKIWYAIFGHGLPVVMVHGGGGSSEYWGLQIPVLARQYEVIVLDSRGHGRSTRNSQPMTYHLMASDVLAVMDTLHVQKAALVGWSDGGIIGLDIAINHPERLTKLFAFGANSDTAGTNDVDKPHCLRITSTDPKRNTKSCRRLPRNTRRS